jgi:hypothetical protein
MQVPLNVLLVLLASFRLQDPPTARPVLRDFFHRQGLLIAQYVQLDSFQMRLDLLNVQFAPQASTRRREL